jgi:HlyD family secretion protein
MRIRLSVVAPLALVIALGGAPTPWPGQSPVGWGLPVSAAWAQPVRNLLNRLFGESMPAGIVKTNGRIEATQVNVAAKYPGRLVEVTVEEGSDVTQGQVIGKISSPEQEAKLRAAQSNLQRAKDSEAAAEAEIVSRQSARDFAKSEVERGEPLVTKNVITPREFELRKRNFETADAALKTVIAQRDAAQAAVKTAEADVEHDQSVLQELVLVSPRSGRVLYQLLRSGEVVAAGAPIVTILDLTDVYMTIFLPGADAAKLAIGGEARIILDAVPDYVIPATVSFVSAEAQFTPKTVETKEEREKLMFRIKLKVDPQVLQKYYTRVKTGVRGMGFVRTNAATAWPDDLQVKLPAQ